jgi:hypothetical protein|tara:strand:- start:627 stop:830 length:204 start_codon:yes stop_codon:yes gene_type:complete
MRIDDEILLFDIGDRVLTKDGRHGIIDKIMTSSVYYEARPIASFMQYTYVVLIEEKKLYLRADQLIK